MARKHVELPARFGMWEVLGEGAPRVYSSGATHRTIRVRCACTLETSVDLYQLLNGGSVGCRDCIRRYRPKVGDRIGSLTIIRANLRHDWPGQKGTAACEVRCDCGTVKLLKPGDLGSGRVRSCGCAKRASGSNCKSWRGHGEIALNLFKQYKRNAAIRGHSFEVTIEYIWDLFVQQNRRCALTGVDLSLSTYRLDETTASLDRIDSGIGYLPGNVQWVHKNVNLMKQGLKQSAFIAWCKLVAAHPE